MPNDRGLFTIPTVFSNRGRILKLLIPFGIFALLCADAAWRIGSRYPHFADIAVDPGPYVGREIWIPTSPIVESTSHGIIVEARGARMKLRTPERPAVGSYVTVRGTVNADGTLDVKEIHVAENWKAQRGGIYGISAVVLFFCAIGFLKRFRIGLNGFAPKETPPQEAVNG